MRNGFQQLSGKSSFVKLFEPCRIGRMTLKNRFVLPAISTNFGTRDGWVTNTSKDYYEERARGGVALIIVETICVDFPVGKGSLNEPTGDTDRAIEGLSALAAAIHKHGAKAAAQLHHAGREAHADITGSQPVAPSAVPFPGGGEMPRALLVEEIRALVESFGQAAARVKRAGFDGVEIHGAAGYLVAQFISRAANKRTDEYGGPLKNRARFLLEILGAIKTQVGSDYPVWCRLNAMEFGMEDGLTTEESKELAGMAQSSGADALNLQVFGVDPYRLISHPSVPGALLPLAEGWKKAVSIPVIAVGRLSPETAEKALEDGKADLIAIGRGLIADPEIPNKVASGNLKDIRPCIACERCGEQVMLLRKQMRCSVNPACGREAEFRMTPTQRRKKVLVVGGGPAGMEAARVAALRGHDVTLCERAGVLGGQLRLAVVPPGKRDKLEPLTDYLVGQMERQQVNIALNNEATRESIQAMAPDAVVVAAGAKPGVPDILGVDGSNVVLADDVLAGKAQVGNRVVILGGELVGCETADYLAQNGHKVTVVRRGPRMAVKMIIASRAALLRRLRSQGVTLIPGIKSYEEISDKGLVIVNGEGKRALLEGDTFVIATGSMPANGLFRELQGHIADLHLVGDAIEPRNLMDALCEGNKIGRVL